MDKFYIGETANIDNRLELHHLKTFSKSFTAKANDWKLTLMFQTDSKENAIYLE